MISYINVFCNNKYYCFSILNNSNYSRIELVDDFVIDVFKDHNHLYHFKAFFYKSKRIYSNIYTKTKSDLILKIKDLLQQELYHV